MSGVGRPGAAIQWTNTEVCLDVWCGCGADLHHDGSINGLVQCNACGRRWVVEVTLRAPRDGDYPHTPTVLTEDDE